MDSLEYYYTSTPGSLSDKLEATLKNKGMLYYTDHRYTTDKIFTTIYIYDDDELMEIAQNLKIKINGDRIEIIREIIDSLNRCRPVDEVNLLLKAAEINHVKMVQLLVKKGADINEALITASETGYITTVNVEAVKLLLQNGADIHADDDEPLRVAIVYGNTDVAKLLIESGANVHAYDDIALRESAKYGDLDLVNFLLEKKANIHAKKEESLVEAAQNDHINIVKLLLANGANIQNALISAAEKGYDRAAENIRKEIMAQIFTK